MRHEDISKEPQVEKADSIFGSVEDADREMFAALGITPEETGNETLTVPSGIENTAEERERLEKELAKELSKLSVNPVSIRACIRLD